MLLFSLLIFGNFCGGGGQGLDEGGQSHGRFSPQGKTPRVKLVHSFVLPNKRMQFNMISHVLTELLVFSTNISKQFKNDIKAIE